MTALACAVCSHSANKLSGIRPSGDTVGCYVVMFNGAALVALRCTISSLLIFFVVYAGFQITIIIVYSTKRKPVSCRRGEGFGLLRALVNIYLTKTGKADVEFVFFVI